MKLADGVGAVGLAQRKRGHVELLGIVVRPTSELDQALDIESGVSHEGSRELAHERSVKALVAGRYRRVDREHGVALDLGQCLVHGRAVERQLAHALDDHERGMSFVEVPYAGLDLERAQRTHATHAEHHLLVQTHLAAADVEDVRDRPVGDVVVGDVRVE